MLRLSLLITVVVKILPFCFLTWEIWTAWQRFHDSVLDKLITQWPGKRLSYFYCPCPLHSTYAIWIRRSDDVSQPLIKYHMVEFCLWNLLPCYLHVSEFRRNGWKERGEVQVCYSENFTIGFLVLKNWTRWRLVMVRVLINILISSRAKNLWGFIKLVCQTIG